MRRLLVGFFILYAASVAPAAHARNTEYHLKVDGVLHNPEYKQKLGDDVAFYFGAQRVSGVEQSFGEFVTNRKTNSFGKSDEEACRWAMLSALVQLRERAEKIGGNAVVNIVSYYKKNTATSDTDYECHAGGIVAGVALKGTIVKIKR